MKKVLIGYILNGKSGGVDRYLMNVRQGLSGDARIDFLTTHRSAELEAMLSKSGSRLFEVPRATRPVEHYRAVKRIIDENKYDAVYFNISTGLMFPGVLAAKKVGAQRIVVHSHAAGADSAGGLKKSVAMLLHRIGRIVISRSATDFFACSETAGNWMFTKRIMNSNKFSIVNNAIRVENFVYDEDARKKTREALGIPDSALVLGHVGNFLYAKNHDFLIDVFAACHERHPDSRLIMVGDGPLRDGIEKKVYRLGLSKNTVFIGECESTAPYLQAMDIFLMPSHFEGFGIAAVEAQCTGLPCILSDSIPKSVDLTSLNSFLPTDNPICWADAIDKAEKYERRDYTELVAQKGFSLSTVDFDKIVFGGSYA